MSQEAATDTPDTRERIVITATALFAAGGIKGTSLLSVADAAGISRGTLFYHYKSKEDLVCDVAERHMGRVSEQLLATARDQASRRAPLAALLEVLVARITEDAGRSRMHYFLIHEILDGNERIRKRMAASYETWTGMIARECSLISGLAEDKTASALTVALLDGLIIRKSLGIDTPEPRESAQALIAIFGRQNNTGADSPDGERTDKEKDA